MWSAKEESHVSKIYVKFIFFNIIKYFLLSFLVWEMFNLYILSVFLSVIKLYYYFNNKER